MNMSSSLSGYYGEQKILFSSQESKADSPIFRLVYYAEPTELSWLLIQVYVTLISCYKTAQRSHSGHSGITQSQIRVLEEFRLACAVLQELVD